jgi:hypothetical protein
MCRIARVKGPAEPRGWCRSKIERRLSGLVTYGYVRDFLNLRSHGKKQLFEREGYGRYRLHVVDQRELWPASFAPVEPKSYGARKRPT